MVSAPSRSRRGSLRTQLIVWNVVALALLLAILGVVIRYTVSSFLLLSVNRELEKIDRPMFGGGPRPPGNFSRGGQMFSQGDRGDMPPPMPGVGPGDMGGGMGDPNGPGMPAFTNNDRNNRSGRRGANGFNGFKGGDKNGPRPPWGDDMYHPRHFDLKGKPLMPLAITRSGTPKASRLPRRGRRTTPR
jgi:hypothetical protein